jgi:hypothetical protein
MGVSSSNLNMSGFGGPRRFPVNRARGISPHLAPPNERVEAWGLFRLAAIAPGLKPGDFTHG